MSRPRKLGKVHSGSPFREMLEDPGYHALSGEFVEFGAQGHQCSKIHSDYVLEKGGRIIWMNKDILSKSLNPVEVFKKEVLDKFFKSDRDAHKIFVSFDIDSIRGSDCPGVSCPGIIGLTGDDALKICFESGKHAQVALMDASEFNPIVEKSRTARLLATMFYFFVLGVAIRTREIVKRT
jgi:formiminoglutamase